MRGANGGGIVFGNGASIGRRSLLIALVALVLLAPSALGQIYQWEYVDPSDPSKGKQQGTMFTPDGATADPNDLADIYGKDHTRAYLPGISFVAQKLQSTIFDEAYLAGADFRSLRTQGTWSGRYADFTGANFGTAHFGHSDFTGANFTGANLNFTFFEQATVTDAIFTDAIIANASLSGALAHGFTKEMLYQTASYKQRSLGAIKLGGGDLRGWDFSNQSMGDASLYGTLLDGADFTGAVLGPADFVASNLSAQQLYSTTDYKSGVLDGIELGRSDLSGWNFANQSLVQARIVEGNMSNAIFDGADLTEATIGGDYVNEGVSFRGANLNRLRYETGGGWIRADLTGAILTNTNLGAFSESTFDDAIITDSTIGFSPTRFTTANFVSTASFKNGELTNIETRYADFSGVDFQGADISGALWYDLNVDGADFSGVKAHGALLNGSMVGTKFTNADLTGARFRWDGAPAIDFRGANLSYTGYGYCVLTNVDMTDAIIVGANFTSPIGVTGFTKDQLYSTASYKSGFLGSIVLGGDLREWDFRIQDLSGARFEREANLEGALWEGATLVDTVFFVNSLPNADFRTADLRGTQFLNSNLEGSDFRGAQIVGARISDVSLVGARFDNATVHNTSFHDTDITNVSFRNADLRGSGFESSNQFSGVDFTGADIRYATFRSEQGDFPLAIIAGTRSFVERDLTGIALASNTIPDADFSDFRLAESDFNRATLTNANFSRADLTGANFEYAHIDGASFTDAIVRQVSFRGTGSYGFSRQMLESTASYKNRDLFGINLEGIAMEFWDFRAQDLRGADLRDSTLRGALMDLADLRSALMPDSNGPNSNPQPNDIPNADLSRTIRRTGRLDLLRVDPGEVLTIRNAVDMNGLPTPTNIQLGVAVFNGGGTLRFLLSEDPWKSTLVVPSNRPEYLLSDTLELGFDRDTDPYALLDKPIQLILWPRSLRTGEFNVVSDPKYTWDLSKLYTNGTVRLVGIVPEPATIATTLLLTAFAGGWLVRRRRQ